MTYQAPRFSIRADLHVLADGKLQSTMMFKSISARTPVQARQTLELLTEGQTFKRICSDMEGERLRAIRAGCEAYGVFFIRDEAEHVNRSWDAHCERFGQEAF